MYIINLSSTIMTMPVIAALITVINKNQVISYDAVLKHHMERSAKMLRNLNIELLS